MAGGAEGVDRSLELPHNGRLGSGKRVAQAVGQPTGTSREQPDLDIGLARVAD